MSEPSKPEDEYTSAILIPLRAAVIEYLTNEENKTDA
jgi:hypothetical protein